MQKSLLYKALLIVSSFALMIFIFLYLTDRQELTGPFLIISLITLAVAVRGFKAVKGLSYSLLIITAVVISMYYPKYFLGFGDFSFKLLIIPLLQIIMFGMGSQMSLKDFAGVITMPKGIIVGIICQFSIMPVIGITLATVFEFPPEIAAGIILVGSSPSGLASNVMSFIAKANLALSVTLTAFATLLSPLLTPLLMKSLGGQFIEIHFWKMMIGIFDIVILPICGGLIFNLFSNKIKSKQNALIQCLSYFLIIFFKNIISSYTVTTGMAVFVENLIFDLGMFVFLPIIGSYLFKYFVKGNKKLLDSLLSFISMAGIGIIITVITAAGRDSLLEVGSLLIIACFLHNMIGYALGYGIGMLMGMSKNDCQTIALEVGMQNSGLASGLAVQMGKVATLGLAPAVFGPLMNITGSSLANWWRGNKEK